MSRLLQDWQKVQNVTADYEYTIPRRGQAYVQIVTGQAYVKNVTADYEYTIQGREQAYVEIVTGPANVQNITTDEVGSISQQSFSC